MATAAAAFWRMFDWRISSDTTVIARVSDYDEKAFKEWGSILVLLPYNAGHASVLSDDIGLPRSFSPTEPYSSNQEQTRRDGYYAVPYWQERRGRIYFNTIIYKRMFNLNPDIFRLEFDWEEIR